MRNQELHPRTAVINKKQKNKAKKARFDALLWLTVHFPKAFDNTVSIQPLKIGIMEDILTRSNEAESAGISKSKLREAVVIYTRRIDYLTCLKAREMRIDLDGHPVAPVTEEEAARASSKIKKRVEKSAKNARKLMQSKQTNTASMYHSVAPSSTQRTPPAAFHSASTFTPFYPERPPAYSMNNNQAPKAAAVVIKHKTTRQYDPDAVARLKEKLGLARQIDVLQEKESI